MTRHSFIQMSKLSNVKGRISYITSHARQENLYATYRTADNAFWSDLAKECQQEFKRSGADGKCIEARELIIALPEVYTAYEPQQVLEDGEFQKVSTISASLQKRLLENGMPPRLLERIAGGGVKLDTGKEETA